MPISNSADIALSVPAIVRDDVDQARQQRRSERIEFAGQRVGDRDEQAASRRREELGRLRFDEAERHRL